VIYRYDSCAVDDELGIGPPPSSCRSMPMRSPSGSTRTNEAVDQREEQVDQRQHQAQDAAMRRAGQPAAGFGARIQPQSVP